MYGIQKDLQNKYWITYRKFTQNKKIELVVNKIFITLEHMLGKRKYIVHYN